MNYHYGMADRHIRTTVGFAKDIGHLLLMNAHGERDCKLDHGERTNRKLKDQPFFQRGRNGKMKQY